LVFSWATNLWRPRASRLFTFSFSGRACFGRTGCLT
jgi:hypothetical protein